MAGECVLRQSSLSEIASARPRAGQASARYISAVPIVVVAATSLALSGCSVISSRFSTPSGFDSNTGTSASRRVAGFNDPIPRGGGRYKIGDPYQVSGRWYVPREETDYDRVGVASWYGDDFHGRYTANGEIFDMRALTAAHQTLPLPSYAYVTNLTNGRTILVRINDRGPFVNDRMIDLSQASAHALGYHQHGLARVRVRYAGPAPLSGDDSRERAHLAGIDRDRMTPAPAYRQSSLWGLGSPPPAYEPPAPWSPLEYRSARPLR